MFFYGVGAVSAIDLVQDVAEARVPPMELLARRMDATGHQWSCENVIRRLLGTEVLHGEAQVLTALAGALRQTDGRLREGFSDERGITRLGRAAQLLTLPRDEPSTWHALSVAAAAVDGAEAVREAPKEAALLLGRAYAGFAAHARVKLKYGLYERGEWSAAYFKYHVDPALAAKDERLRVDDLGSRTGATLATLARSASVRACHVMATAEPTPLQRTFYEKAFRELQRRGVHVCVLAPPPSGTAGADWLQLMATTYGVDVKHKRVPDAAHTSMWLIDDRVAHVFDTATMCSTTVTRPERVGPFQKKWEAWWDGDEQ